AAVGPAAAQVGGQQGEAGTDSAPLQLEGLLHGGDGRGCVQDQSRRLPCWRPPCLPAAAAEPGRPGPGRGPGALHGAARAAQLQHAAAAVPGVVAGTAGR
ncbi:hypothetical protein HaLaN_26908, partial [Haematococcus lacustris]